MSNLSVSTISSESDDDLTLDEVISANPPMQQQPNYQPFPLSSRSTRILVQRVPNPQGNLLSLQNFRLPRPLINQQPQWNVIQNQNVPVVVQRVQNPQGNLRLPRSAINQQPQWNAIQNQNVPVVVQRVQNPQGNLLPPQNLHLPRSAINQHPQRNIIHNQNVPVAEVVEGDASEDIQPCLIDGPIVNRLYDPNFAAIGLPVDPYLRMLKLNPDWCNVPERK